jgi:hypothetical protein
LETSILSVAPGENLIQLSLDRRMGLSNSRGFEAANLLYHGETYKVIERNSLLGR